MVRIPSLPRLWLLRTKCTSAHAPPMRGRRGRARARGGGTRRRGAGTLNFHRGTGPGAGRDWDSPPERVPTGPWCHPRWAPPRRPRGGPDGPAPPRRGHTMSVDSLHERAAAMAAPERQGAPPCPGGPKHVSHLGLASNCSPGALERRFGSGPVPFERP